MQGGCVEYRNRVFKEKTRFKESQSAPVERKSYRHLRGRSAEALRVLNSVELIVDYAHRAQVQRFLHNERLKSVGFRYVLGNFNRHVLPQRNNTMVRISPRPLYPTYKTIALTIRSVDLYPTYKR